MRLSARPAYAYRTDPNVPAFDDHGPVVFMDGDCALCSRGARWIARRDTDERFSICPIQSPLGQAMLMHFDIDQTDPETWILLHEGKGYTSLDAMIRVGALLGGPGHLLTVLAPLPRAFQDWIYRRIARNRYALFGNTDMCAIPDPELRKRLVQ
ncbi:thiol-disulfide oxidoreductase DCC family protein [Minwuia sp.]|uniref:thiol-disulfide oxidoreductase DCC family protein n=1 Tax=Minwuia sp. TaxID=2493630 RepID=UPI003A8FE644